MPEAAWRPVAPLRAEATPAARSTATSGRRPPLTAARAPERVARPVWLFEPPRPIDSKQLTLLRGPERIETGWWGMVGADEVVGAFSRSRSDNAETVAIGRSLPQQPPLNTWRDYYVARHENGAECWVFVDAGARWHLHGYFG